MNKNNYVWRVLKNRNVSDIRFFALDWDQVLKENFEQDIIKDKVIII